MGELAHELQYKDVQKEAFSNCVFSPMLTDNGFHWMESPTKTKHFIIQASPLLHKSIFGVGVTPVTSNQTVSTFNFKCLQPQVEGGGWFGCNPPGWGDSLEVGEAYLVAPPPRLPLTPLPPPPPGSRWSCCGWRAGPGRGSSYWSSLGFCRSCAPPTFRGRRRPRRPAENLQLTTNEGSSLHRHYTKTISRLVYGWYSCFVDPDSSLIYFSYVSFHHQMKHQDVDVLETPPFRHKRNVSKMCLIS